MFSLQIHPTQWNLRCHQLIRFYKCLMNNHALSKFSLSKPTCAKVRLVKKRGKEKPTDGNFKVTIRAHKISLEDSARSSVAPFRAKQTDRRSSNSPVLHRKLAEDNQAHAEQGDNDGALGEKLQVTVWVGKTSTLLQAHSSFKILTEQDLECFDKDA